VRVLRQAQRRLSPAEQERLIADYEAGARVCELAKDYGLHRRTVVGHVARAGKTRPVMTEAQIDEAVTLYGDGWTLHNVGQPLGGGGFRRFGGCWWSGRSTISRAGAGRWQR